MCAIEQAAAEQRSDGIRQSPPDQRVSQPNEMSERSKTHSRGTAKRTKQSPQPNKAKQAGSEKAGRSHGVSRKRSYTDQEKGQALALLDVYGGNLSRTAKETDIPRKTIAGWAKERGTNPAVAEIRQEVKKSFVEQLQIIKGLVADQIVERIDEFEPRDLTGLLKISTELEQLLTGEPTERTEFKGEVAVTDARERLARKLDSVASRIGTPRGPEFVN